MKHIKLSELRVRAARQLGNADNWPTTLPYQLDIRITPPPYDFESSPGMVAMRPMLQLGEGDSAEYFDSIEVDTHSISIVSDEGSPVEGFLQKGEGAGGDFFLLGNYPLPMFAAVTDAGVSTYRLLPIGIPGVMHTTIEIIQDPPMRRVC